MLFTAKSEYLVTCFGAFYIEGNVGLVLEVMDLGSLSNLIKECINLHITFPENMLAHIIQKVF